MRVCGQTGCTLTIKASQTFVCRGLTGRVSILSFAHTVIVVSQASLACFSSESFLCHVHCSSETPLIILPVFSTRFSSKFPGLFSPTTLWMSFLLFITAILLFCVETSLLCRLPHRSASWLAWLHSGHPPHLLLCHHRWSNILECHSCPSGSLQAPRTAWSRPLQMWSCPHPP